ncbi:hypothetical protein N7462_007984 [Penicillium macrosclerotiorum]|uniref:uncharacterized protein n=1 Tax=Penicillium macrosclerotiorum TaxID=303699 RepID=UPI002547EE7C|nr:uncharacterized protein N7462_007984 [Penicillium macrosclerotiorum]KAJ5679740.1 hypothetical protein N7462_007984 [Penicillium macrosclerotiorum]
MENQHEPPGTSRIYNGINTSNIIITSHSALTASNYSLESNLAVIETEFVVQPTPSDDPNDPLVFRLDFRCLKNLEL